MQLEIMDPTFSVVKLPSTDSIPTWAAASKVFSITRTDEELSIVCPTEDVPADDKIEDIERDWKCIKVNGILDFNLTGILSSLANPLAENEISIFAISTFNTDYLLVKNHSIDKAKTILESGGHSFVK